MTLFLKGACVCVYCVGSSTIFPALRLGPQLLQGRDPERGPKAAAGRRSRRRFGEEVL